MTLRLFAFLLIFTSSFVQSHEQEKYSRVKIYTDEKGLKEISSAGVAVDHGEYKKGVFFISEFSASELQIIRGLGYSFDVIIDDVYRDWLEKNKQELPKSNSRNICSTPVNFADPSGFQLGSMGGYFTYQEMLDHLDTLAARFPNLITVKQAVNTNTSIGGLPIYYVKVSDNPYLDENEPEMLYTALHHAREPGSLSQMIYYLYYLLENYGNNDEATYIINNTQLYFIPCLNPDGYIFNQLNQPGGGGMWRKNRRNNGNGSFGVDLNRNYGSQFWGMNNTGSSPNTNSDTYRGTAGFSEPETQAIRDFCNDHQFKITLNYHTFGNLLVYPYGHAPDTYTPDSALFVNVADFLTKENKYVFGTGNQTVGYTVNGDSDDWMYDEQVTKPKIFAMTPECGEGFWMPQNTILDLCRDALRMNIKAALLLNSFAEVSYQSSPWVSSPQFAIPLTVKSLGLDNGTFNLTANPLHPALSIANSTLNFSGLNHLQTASGTFQFMLDTAQLNAGQTISVEIINSNGAFSSRDTLSFMYGFPQILWTESGTQNIFVNASSQWQYDNQVFFSAPRSVADSPGSLYPDNSYKVATASQSADLSNAMAAWIQFKGKWEIEPGYDYVQLQASSDNGNSWQSLCGKYTVIGTQNQAPGEPLYQGFITNWVDEIIDLQDFIGQTIQLRFVFYSDGFVNYAGFNFDDFEVIRLNAQPVGISQTTAKDGVRVYPVPAQDYLRIEFSKGLGLSQPEQLQLTVTDISGKEIMTQNQTNSNGSVQLDIKDLSPGYYFLKTIFHEGNSVVKPFVKQ
jgi:carboxypeptidase T